MTSATAQITSRFRTAWKDVLHSSLGDLLTGRVSPNRETKDIIRRANLPEPLTEMIYTVVKRSRLWHSERAAIAEELVAHFQDGLAAGATVEELRGAFGDPRQSARLIRRAAQRNRPLPWLILSYTLRGAAALVALIVLLYIGLAIWIGLGSPSLGHNYWKQYNEPVLATPTDERAWPLYREGLLSLTGDAAKLLQGEVSTRNENWPQTVAYLERNQKALDLFRAAADRPHFGYVYTPNSDPELNAWLQRFSGSEATVPANEPPTLSIEDNPPLLTMLLPHLSPLRTAARLLVRDALLAADTGDAERMLTDIRATLAIANHLDEGDQFLITELVSVACARLAFQFVQDVLLEYPEVLSDQQLVELTHLLLATRGGGRFVFDYTTERDSFNDVLQRLYTEAGYPVPDFLTEVMQLSTVAASGAGDVGRVPVALSPLAAAFVADRSTMAAKYDEVMDASEDFADLPLWERGVDRSTELILALQAGPLERFRYILVTVLTPSLTHAAHLAEIATQHRDVTVAAIALELYRREHGHWPESLDALAPRYLPKVPVDRFTGKPLNYRRVGGQPLLYSVGVDRDDDGGRLVAANAGPGLKLPTNRNKAARHWLAPAEIQRLRGTEQGRRYDGDWILWPRVTDPPGEN